MADRSGDEPDWDGITTSVFRYGLSRGLRQSTAEDIAQKVTYRAWLHWSKGVVFARGIMPWVFVTARNEMRHHRRDAETHRRIEEIYLHRDDNVVIDPEDVAETVTIAQALEQLPDEERTVIQQHYFGGLDYEPIGENLGGRPSSTARSLSHRGRAHLKEILEAKERSND